jgi:hypothetical protein
MSSKWVGNVSKTDNEGSSSHTVSSQAKRRYCIALGRRPMLTNIWQIKNFKRLGPEIN